MKKLAAEGRDVATLQSDIKDLIVKTLLSV
jgi:hypothetical protein